MINQIKKFLKKTFLYKYYYYFKYRKFNNLSRKRSFEKIYKDVVWGSSINTPFNSGKGSHDLTTIRPYIESVNSFLEKKIFSVTDLGCGDFNIGKNFSNNTKEYNAIDIVPELIDFNKNKYKDLNINFLCLDIVSDYLPTSDVVLLREVLQHLSNRDIKIIVRKIEKLYKYIIVTEKIPLGRFIENKDKLNSSGPGTRLSVNSGIALHLPPFELNHNSKIELCKVIFKDYQLVTTLYKN
jgi:hypothetical protein